MTVRHPIRLDDPCVLFALGREGGPFLREFRPHLPFAGSPCRAQFCGPAWLTVLVGETGVGVGNVQRTLDWLLSRPQLGGVPYEPSLIVFAGFAGALDDSLNIGDIVLANEIVDLADRTWPTSWPAELPAGRWTPPLHRGRILTSDRLIATPEEKQRLGAKHRAIAVDMESAALAARCTEAQIPFTCVRAISDTAATPVSRDLMTLLEGATVSPWGALKLMLRRPSVLPEFWRLGRDTRRAAEQLGLALGELLTLTLPWMNEPGEPPA